MQNKLLTLQNSVNPTKILLNHFFSPKLIFNDMFIEKSNFTLINNNFLVSYVKFFDICEMNLSEYTLIRPTLEYRSRKDPGD